MFQHLRAHLLGADGLEAEGDVAGAGAAGDGFLHGGFDGGGGFEFTEAVAEHHGGGPDLRAGVGDALAGDVGGGAAGGLVEAEGEAEAVLFRAEAGGGEHAEGAADDAHFIGENVAEHVFGEEHVELVGVAGELHGGVVDIHVAQLDFRCVLGKVFGHDLAPEHGGFENVGLVDGADALAAGLGGVDGDLGDALDFAGLVDHGIDGLLFAVFKRGGGLGLAEVDAAGKLADADDVDAVGDALLLERGGIGQLRVKQTWAHIGVEGVGLADWEQGRSLGLFLGGEGFPLRAADGAEEDGFTLVANGLGAVGEGDAVIVDGDTTDVGVFVVEREAELVACGFKDVESDIHDFRADAITG